jgi:hypothetical protein
MVRVRRPRSSSRVIAYFCVLAILFLQALHSAHALPLHPRDTSTICGANLRPSRLRDLCEKVGKIWHFDTEDDFKSMELDKAKFLPCNLQCGEKARRLDHSE